MFYSTEQAVDYGLKADALHLARISDLKEVFRAQYESALHRGRVNLAFAFAVQHQLCDEALNAETIQKRIMD